MNKADVLKVAGEPVAWRAYNTAQSCWEYGEKDELTSMPYALAPQALYTSAPTKPGRREGMSIHGESIGRTICAQELAAANERIRELEIALAKQAGIALDAASRMVDNLQSQIDQIPELIAANKLLKAEREVSGKLEKALREMLHEKYDYMIRNKLGDPTKETVSRMASAALAEVAALRSNKEKTE